MELAFELVTAPRLSELAPFRFVHHRVRGPYTPWSRIATLDAVAETLELAGIDRTGPPFGVYHDLPTPMSPPDRWRADLGHPVAANVIIPKRPGLRVVDVGAIPVAGLRYRGDVASFPQALELMLDWLDRRGVPAEGPLLERFHVSNPLTGEEEREVFVALRSWRA